MKNTKRNTGLSIELKPVKPVRAIMKVDHHLFDGYTFKSGMEVEIISGPIDGQYTVQSCDIPYWGLVKLEELEIPNKKNLITEPRI